MIKKCNHHSCEAEPRHAIAGGVYCPEHKLTGIPFENGTYVLATRHGKELLATLVCREDVTFMIEIVGVPGRDALVGVGAIRQALIMMGGKSLDMNNEG